jgi:hypothetical protein
VMCRNPGVLSPGQEAVSPLVGRASPTSEERLVSGGLPGAAASAARAPTDTATAETAAAGSRG